MATKNGTDRRFYYATAGKVGLVLMAVFLVFYMITILSGSSDFFADSAQSDAEMERLCATLSEASGIECRF